MYEQAKGSLVVAEHSFKQKLSNLNSSEIALLAALTDNKPFGSDHDSEQELGRGGGFSL